MFEGLTKKFRAKKIPECRVCGTRGRDASPSVGRGDLQQSVKGDLQQSTKGNLQ
jgi:hypothetical protein